MIRASTTSISISLPGQKESLTLLGRSRAGDGTSYVIPELKWMFDCGAPIVGWIPSNIFLTHTHADHIHYLTHLKNFNGKEKPPMLYLPEKALPLVKKYLQSHQELIDCGTEEPEESDGTYNKNTDFHYHGLLPDEQINISERYIVSTIKCVHRIDCLGYSVARKRKELKEEYQGWSSQEIGKLHREGVSVKYEYEEPVILILGDTTEGVFQLYPNILSQHRFVLVECSFLDENSYGKADSSMHTHWDRLRPYVEAHPNTLFLLSHFSLKYDSWYIREFFITCNNDMPSKNVHPLLIESEVASDWQKSNDKEKNGNFDWHENETPRCNCFQCVAH